MKSMFVGEKLPPALFSPTSPIFELKFTIFEVSNDFCLCQFLNFSPVSGEWFSENFKYLVIYSFFYNNSWTQLVYNSQFEGIMSFSVKLALPIIVIPQLFYLAGHFWLFSKWCLAYVLTICCQKSWKILYLENAS